MSSTSSATRASSSFDIQNLAPVTTPPPAQPVAVVKEPPKPNPLVEGWKSFKASPHGRALKSWTDSASVIAPIVVTAGAGLAVGKIDPQGASALLGMLAGAAAGIAAIPFQVADKTGIINTYKRAGHTNPYWASFANVFCYMTVPATVVGTGVALTSGSGWGVAASVAAGVIGSFLGLTAQGYRLKDHPAR